MDSLSIKICLTPGCTEGGQRPRLYLAQSYDFEARRFCERCRNLMHKFEEVRLDLTSPNLAGRKRGWSAIDESEEGEIMPRTRIRRELQAQDTTNVDDSLRGAVTPANTHILPSMPILPLAANFQNSQSLTTHGNPLSSYGPELPNTISNARPRTVVERLEEVEYHDTQNLSTREWCLTCNWSNHSTFKCDQRPCVREPLVTLLYWYQPHRASGIDLLMILPSDVPQLLDGLEAHCGRLRRAEVFHIRRDRLLMALLGDQSVMGGLQPTLKDGENCVQVYCSLIESANHVTKTFLVSVANEMSLCHKAMFSIGRDYSIETAVQFRLRVASEVRQTPQAFPLDYVPVQHLQASLMALWDLYKTRMEVLERRYLAERYEGRTPSLVVRRLVRLPTTFFRLNITLTHHGIPLWLPVFDLPKVEKKGKYLDSQKSFELDYPPRPTVQPGTEAENQNTNTEMFRTELNPEITTLASSSTTGRLVPNLRDPRLRAGAGAREASLSKVSDIANSPPSVKQEDNPSLLTAPDTAEPPNSLETECKVLLGSPMKTTESPVMVKQEDMSGW